MQSVRSCLEKVRAVLETMPDDQRQAMELAFFEGCTHTEIARADRAAAGHDQNANPFRVDFHTKGIRSISMTPDLHPGMDELIQYSMGMLDAAAAARVRVHLEQCAECRAQVAQLRTDLTLAAMAVPQIAPPAQAKDRLFQAAGIDLSQSAKAEGSSGGSGANPVAAGNVVSMKPRRRSAAVAWAGWIAAAACLFYAVQVHETNQGMRQRLRTQIAEVQQSNNSAARTPKSTRTGSRSESGNAPAVGHANYRASAIEQFRGPHSKSTRTGSRSQSGNAPAVGHANCRASAIE